MKLTIHATGIRPLLMHNGRMANPIDPHSRRLHALTAKRKKTDDDLIEIMRVEARGAAYETPDGLLALPSVAMFRTLQVAATAFRRGEDVKRSVSYDEDMVPILADGAFVSVDDYLTNPDHILYVPVVVQRRRTMRARPIVHNWAVSMRFSLLEDVMDLRDLLAIVERAGRLVGLCEWRPQYGTFSARVDTE